MSNVNDVSVKGDWRTVGLCLTHFAASLRLGIRQWHWYRQWRVSFIVSLLLHVSGQVYPSTLAAASPSHWPTSNNIAMHTGAATLRGIAT